MKYIILTLSLCLTISASAQDTSNIKRRTITLEKEPDITEIVNVSSEPIPLNLFEVQQLISYPDTAKANGIEGMVVIRVLVGRNGEYVRHRVIKSANPLLSEVCEAQMPKLRFTPAFRGEEPLMFWVNVPFRFKLSKD